MRSRQRSSAPVLVRTRCRQSCTLVSSTTFAADNILVNTARFGPPLHLLHMRELECKVSTCCIREVIQNYEIDFIDGKSPQDTLCARVTKTATVCQISPIMVIVVYDSLPLFMRESPRTFRSQGSLSCSCSTKHSAEYINFDEEDSLQTWRGRT